jgi:uncharacterized membrane protein YbhN (UPF0104 family)
MERWRIGGETNVVAARCASGDRHPPMSGAAPPGRTRSARWPRLLLLLSGAGVAAWAAARAPAAGASFGTAFALIGNLSWVQVVGLATVWILGLCVHAFVLAACLPGLTVIRGLTLNLTGSAVSNVLPLGGLAGTALNLTMTRAWGHSGRDFARFVVVSNACAVIAKLVMPAVALLALLAAGDIDVSGVGAWSPPALVAFATGLLLLWALCGRTAPLLRLVTVAARLGTRLARRTVGRTWPEQVSSLLRGADQLVRRHRVALTLGMAGYWLAQAALLWCCLLAVGVRPHPAVVLAGLVAERLTTLIVMTPGGAGPAEAGMVAALIGLGVDPTGALAGVLLFRAFVFAAEIPVGAVVGAAWWVTRWARLRRNGASTCA